MKSNSSNNVLLVPEMQSRNSFVAAIEGVQN
jgi:hypothetical protein